MQIHSSIAFDASLKSTPEKQDAALRKACSEFEALLVSQILHKMRDSVPKSDLFGSRDKEEMFQSMLDDEMARDMSSRGALGLGELLYQQLSRK